MRGAGSRPATSNDDWGPWTEYGVPPRASAPAPRLPRKRRRRWFRRFPRQRPSDRSLSSTLLLVAAAALAVVGAGLIAWAAASQVHPPTPPPVSEPSPAEEVPVQRVVAVPLLATPYATGPSSLGPFPARWWWGDLVPTTDGLLPDGPDGGPAPVPVPPPTPAEMAADRQLASVPISPPATIRIPTIGVDSPVDSVGLTPTGEMEVPAPGPGYDHAAWYRSSVTPGRQGPSVIIGHIDSRANGPSVFFRLGGMHPGDRVEVTRADGVTVAFEVTDVRNVSKDAFPTEAVYGATRGAELRLISCGGSFDSSVRSYRDNIVVFARALPPPPVRAAPPVPTTPAPGVPARIPAHPA